MQSSDWLRLGHVLTHRTCRGTTSMKKMPINRAIAQISPSDTLLIPKADLFAPPGLP